MTENKERGKMTRKRNASLDLLQYACDNRKEGYFNDVTIVSSDNQFIPANRMVLSCHSAFFETMFKTEMKEKYEPNIEVRGIDGMSVKTIVDYFYTGSIDIASENVMDLLSASDFLQLDELKAFCFEFLQTIIAEENCCAILAAASAFQHEKIRAEALRFVCENFSLVSKMEDFLLLSRENLISCLSNIKRTNTDETAIYEAIIKWTKHETDNRKGNLPYLLNMIDLNKFPGKYMEEVVSNEPLIRENVFLANLLIDKLSRLLKNKEIGENTSRVISFGGNCTSNKILEVYNIQGQPPSNFSILPIDFQKNTTVKFRDTIYCIKQTLSTSNANEVCKCSLHDKELSQWEKVEPMLEYRQFFDAAVFRGVLVVAGGRNGLIIRKSAECFIPRLNGWKSIPSLNNKRYGLSLVSTDETLFALGGIIEEDCGGFGISVCSSAAEQLNGLNGKWKNVTPMNVSRKHMAAVNLNGVVYAIGGKTRQDTTLDTVEKYDSETDKWINVKSMNRPRSSHAACVLRGKIYVVGGVDNENHFVKEIECYEPHQNEWFFVGSTQHNLSCHTIVNL